MNYTWNIDNITVLSNDTQQNIVRTFDWTITAENNGFTKSYSSIYHVTLENDVIDNFVEFNLFTQADFVEWIVNALGNELDLIKEDLARDVKKQESSATIQTVVAPWN